MNGNEQTLIALGTLLVLVPTALGIASLVWERKLQQQIEEVLEEDKRHICQCHECCGCHCCVEQECDCCSCQCKVHCDCGCECECHEGAECTCKVEECGCCGKPLTECQCNCSCHKH